MILCVVKGLTSSTHVVYMYFAKFYVQFVNLDVLVEGPFFLTRSAILSLINQQTIEATQYWSGKLINLEITWKIQKFKHLTTYTVAVKSRVDVFCMLIFELSRMLQMLGILATYTGPAFLLNSFRCNTVNSLNPGVIL